MMNEEFLDAATQGDVAKVKEMLATDPSLIQTTDQNGVSVVLKATYHGQREVVDALLSSGLELNIFEAAATGETQRIKDLISSGPQLVNSYSPDGFTPLGLATFFGHAETVNALLAAGAEVNAAYRESMQLTPLGSAMAVGRNDIARKLIEHGADVNVKAANDTSPLHTAAARGNLESAALLLDHGADLSASTTDGKTPVAYAEEHDHPDMVEFLKKHQAG